MSTKTTIWTLPTDIKTAIVGARHERLGIGERFMAQRDLDARGLAGSVRLAGTVDAGWVLALDVSAHASRSDTSRIRSALVNRIRSAGYEVTEIGRDEIVVRAPIAAEDLAWLNRWNAA